MKAFMQTKSVWLSTAPLQKALAILNDEPLWDVKNPEVCYASRGNST